MILNGLAVFCVWVVVTECNFPEFTPEVMASYRERVKKMFYHAYNGYLDYAFPLDELKPISCTGMDTWGSFSLTLIDALDTLVIMGNYSEFERATKVVLKNVDYNANVNVSVFETNIRVVGGLLSAHMLSGIAGVELESGWPCSGPLLRLAERFADKLLPAFNTKTGMPYGTVNLRYGVHAEETPVTCTAGVGTFLLEFASLSRLTGSPTYERVATKALKELWLHRSAINLVGNHINVQTGQWTATDAGIGAGVDSYFEYLVKGSALFSKPALMRQFMDYKRAIDKHLKHDHWFMWGTMTKGHITMPIFQSLEQFWPGLLTLIGEIEEAKHIILNYYGVLRQYGFSPEFYHVQNSEAVQKRSGYPLRPEFVESLMYLYQATDDPMYLEMGVSVFEAIESNAKTRCGYATVQNVKDHTLEDRMESFFLAETTKYLYLLFDPDNFIHNPGETGRIVDTPSGQCVVETGGYFFNTEAHPLDPSILYCCSAQRQRDVDLIAKFQDNIDLLSLLGLNDGAEDDWSDKANYFGADREEFLNELKTPSEGQPKPEHNAEEASEEGDADESGHGSRAANSESASKKRRTQTIDVNGTIVEVGYEVDESVVALLEAAAANDKEAAAPQNQSALGQDQTESAPPVPDTESSGTSGEARLIEGSSSNDTEELVEDVAAGDSHLHHLSLGSAEITEPDENVDVQSVTGKKGTASSQEIIIDVAESTHKSATASITIELDVHHNETRSTSAQSPARDFAWLLKSFEKTTSPRSSCDSSANANANVLLMKYFEALGGDKAAKVSLLKMLAELDEFIGATKRLESVNKAFHARCSDAERSNCSAEDFEAENRTECQRDESDSRTLNRLLNLMYNKDKRERAAFLHPVCFKGESPKEEDMYINVRPNTAKLKGLERDMYLDGPTVEQIDLHSLNVKQLSQYRYHVQSCRRPPFESRLSVMGEVMAGNN